MPQREKYWSELTETERVERLRQVIKTMQYTIEYVQSENIKLRNHFYKHFHNADGKLMGPINEYDGSTLSNSCGLARIGGSSNPDETYI